MSAEKRKAPRRNIRQRGLVAGLDNAPLVDCTVADVSETGAQLKLVEKDGFPEEFNLILAKGGTVRRQCKVVWRDKGRMGVRFRNMQRQP